MPRRSPQGEGGPLSTRCSLQDSEALILIYVYILRSVRYPERYYIGIARDLRSRLKKHNGREVSHTSKYAPWTIKTYIAFSNDAKAFAFEKYLKTASGRAFAKKRF
jgi:putative endonuclease